MASKTPPHLNLCKNFIRSVASRISIDTYQRLLGSSILREAFDQIASVPVFETREQLWDECIFKQIAASTRMTYVEFGVYKGYSIEYFAKRNSNSQSQFIGLDSFEGLPEDWGTTPKGAFDVSGNIPKIPDTRVSFIKGRFQDTWNDLYLRLANTGITVVHYDADLYSSTLFALSKIDNFNKSYIAIFDEFPGHEARALYNYSQAFGATVSFIGKTNSDNNQPHQVMCRITPHLAARG